VAKNENTFLASKNLVIMRVCGLRGQKPTYFSIYTRKEKIYTLTKKSGRVCGLLAIFLIRKKNNACYGEKISFDLYNQETGLG